jgi:hypothetical protein
MGRDRFAAIPSVLLGVSAEFAEWSTAGLETVFFLFLLLASLERLLHEIEEGGRPLSSLLFALLALTRPEGAAFFAVTVALSLLSRVVSRAPHLSFRDMALRVAVFLALFAPYFLWRLSYYGQLLPNTYYAKYRPHGGASYVLEFLVYLAPVALLAVAALVRAFLRWVSRLSRLSIFLAWGLFFVNVAGIWNVQPAMGWDWRLLLHLVPLFYLLALLFLVPFFRSERRGIRFGAIACTVLLVGWCAQPHLLQGRVREARACAVGIQEAHIAIGTWLERIAPPGAVVATVDTGAIPYFSRLRSLDIANIPLHNKEWARPRLPIREYVRGFWLEDPRFFVVRADEEGGIPAHGLRKVLIDGALERGFIAIRWARYREDYFLCVYADPKAVRRPGPGASG